MLITWILFSLCLLSRPCFLFKLAKKIPGPRSLNDRIAIVGAGPAGIHMALELKKLGFTNVEILERFHRIGGKSLSINYRGSIHEMGAVYLAPDYDKSVIPLINQYLPRDDLVFLPPAAIWLDRQDPMTYQKYLIIKTMEIFKANDIFQAASLLSNTIGRYIEIHRKLFGNYDGEIMPEPNLEARKHIHGTFWEFLSRNNLTAMAPILYASNSMQGYGRLDEIACLYGLIWNTPALMQGLKARIEKKTNETSLYMLKSGFQNLWKNIVKKENLHVKKNVRIKSVYRSRLNGYKTVWIKYGQGKNGGSNSKWHRYDFLIWSPDMKSSLKYWHNWEIKDERFYFNKLVPTYFTTALVNTFNATKGESPIDYFIDNVNEKRESSFWAQRDSYAALNGFVGREYASNKYPSGNDMSNMRTTVTYQMSDEKPFYLELRDILRDSLKKIGAKNLKIKYFKTWRYFPRYLPRDMEKRYLWRVIEMQGKYGMWYIGSSVCFESVKSVIEYNKLLLKNMIMPQLI